MSGCYGGDPEDRYFEDKLLNFLDENETDLCLSCGAYIDQCDGHNED